MVEARLWFSTIIPSRMEAAKFLQHLEGESTKNLSFFAESVTVERQLEWLTRMCKPGHRVYVVLDENDFDRWYGTVGLHEIDEINHTARLGALVFHEADRGRGIGSHMIRAFLTKAFTEFGIRKVYVKLLTTNERGQGFYQRLGFVEEARLRKEYLLNGEYRDMVLMSLLKEDWMEVEHV